MVPSSATAGVAVVVKSWFGSNNRSCHNRLGWLVAAPAPKPASALGRLAALAMRVLGGHKS